MTPARALIAYRKMCKGPQANATTTWKDFNTLAEEYLSIYVSQVKEQFGTKGRGMPPKFRRRMLLPPVQALRGQSRLNLQHMTNYLEGSDITLLL